MKQNNKNLYDVNLLEEVVHYANSVCVDAFGRDCALRESAVLDCIIDETVMPVEVIGYTNLVRRLNESPAIMRQHMIIQIAGRVHDRLVEKQTKGRGYTAQRDSYRLSVPWWLVGANEIRRITTIPEVEVVLKTLTIGRKEPVRLCPHGAHMIVQTTIVGRDFDKVYEEYSLAYQKTNYTHRENLPDRLEQGKGFYQHMPDWLDAEIKADPLVPFDMSREICKWVKVFSLSDLEKIAVEEVQRERKEFLKTAREA